MNERSDMDRVLRHWFADGPSEMPDRVVETVAQEQRDTRLVVGQSLADAHIASGLFQQQHEPACAVARG